jgi:hypothetical protein
MKDMIKDELDIFPLYEKIAEYRQQMEDTFAKEERKEGTDLQFS